MRSKNSSAAMTAFIIVVTALFASGTHASAQLAVAEQNFYTAALLAVLFTGIGVLTMVYVLKGVVGPIAKISDTMRLVAEGDLSRSIPFQQRKDEIGFLALSEVRG